VRPLGESRLEREEGVLGDIARSPAVSEDHRFVGVGAEEGMHGR
jgi:hypothetical protein